MNVDVDRQNIIQLKSDLKSQGDSSVQTLSAVVQKLQELELSQRREEAVRNDLQQKLRKSEESNQELTGFIKSLSN